jgi:hypothetical protein
MEYVSIPWENYRKGNSDDYSALTVNLALWFVHILAGNAHEVNWSYPPLGNEQLAIGVCTASSASENSGSELEPDESEPPQPRRSSRLRSYSIPGSEGGAVVSVMTRTTPSLHCLSRLPLRYPSIAPIIRRKS